MMWRPVLVIVVPAVLVLLASGWWAMTRWRHATGRGRVEIVARTLLAAIVVLIGLHPVGVIRIQVPAPAPVDVVVLVDRTSSMGALDGMGASTGNGNNTGTDADRTRISAAIDDLTEIVRQSSGARIAMIVFDDDARVAVPFTTDATTVASYLSTLTWRPASRATGSDIGVGAELADQTLQWAAADRPDHSRHLIYLGDGEQTASTAPGSFAAVAPLLTSATVLGYGTTEGAPMLVSDQGADLVRIDGQVQRSYADPAALKSIAGQLGGRYLNRASAGELPQVVPTRPTTISAQIRPGRDVTWILGLMAAAGIAVLIFGASRETRIAGEEVRHEAR